VAKTFFSPRFGMVADRFGVSWMIYVEPCTENAVAKSRYATRRQRFTSSLPAQQAITNVCVARRIEIGRFGAVNHEKPGKTA
jgi:predicted 3-demethylubiquinone-9 3-methyltransferase (glyoxalase superfamily)